jgi:biotin carboxylase
VLLVLKKVSKSRKHHYPLTAFLDEPPGKKVTIYEALYDNGKRAKVGLQDYKIADIELKHKLLQSIRQKQGDY